MFFLFAILMTFLGSLGAYFFKNTAKETSGMLSLLTCINFYIGAFFYGVSAILNIVLLRYIDYSILYPMTAITYIWTALLSQKLLGETISKKKVAGVFIMVIGVIILNCT
ncbi:EamA family transporter [uncultured Oscillibacter sp.]|uniref:EamA family transporter n=1 Tax=uncultured Oscillibacter sp. TaxID=876091 RepID=UPI0025E0140C|nr:EamA family transporter [uncultured Oscillibacter sp.]